MRTAARVCALVLLATSFAWVQSFAAAVTWPPPTLVSEDGQSAEVVEVVVGPDGTSHLSWRRYDGTFSRVQSSSRPPGGVWSAPVTLDEGGATADTPFLAVGPDGAVTAVWRRQDSGAYRVQSRTRTPAGVWGPIATLSGATLSASPPRVTVGPDGNAVAVWNRSDTVVQRVEVAQRISGVWGPPVMLSAAGQEGTDPSVVVGSDGTATVVWQRSDGTDVRVQESHLAPGAPSWSAPLNVSEGGQDAVAPEVATGPGGATILAWRRSDGSIVRIQASSRPAGGEWTLPVTVSDNGQTAGNHHVAVAPDGAATLVWLGLVGAEYRIQASTRPAGGAWAPVQTLSAPGNSALESRVAVGPDGTAVAAWNRPDESFIRIQVSTRPSGGNWAVPVEVTPAGQSGFLPRVAIGADGTAAIGSQLNGPWLRAQASVVDDAFPPPVVVPETSAITGKKTIKKAKAKYTFSSPTPGAGFECRVDKKFKKYAGVSKKKAKKQVPWKACTSPYAVKAKKLKPGKHKLYVRAVFKGQVDPTPSVKKFKVER